MSLTAERLSSNAGFIYRARHGAAQRAAPRQPLILLLHGLSGDETAMWLFDHALPRSATVVSPRALFAGAEGYSWARSVGRDEVGQVDFSEALAALYHFIPEMIQRYDCDPQRVVALGFSQGAAVSYALSLARPDWMCGVIALAGFMPLGATQPERNALPAEDALRPRYLIIHSLDDDIVPIALAREARSVLEARGAAVEYHEYSGGGHKIAARGMKDIARWIEQIP
jgi:phospholipase/carboxylesterase